MFIDITTGTGGAGAPGIGGSLPGDFDASPLPTWLFETPGLQIYDVNQATIDFYDTRDEFRTMTLYDLRTAEEAERLRAMYAETPHPPLRWNPASGSTARRTAR